MTKEEKLCCFVALLFKPYSVDFPLLSVRNVV
jgi:hypothetical protein